MESTRELPQSFEEMEKGTVFAFKMGDENQYYVWDGWEAICVDKHVAESLALETPEKALRMASDRVQFIQPLGPSSNIPENRDFSRVTIL